MIISSQLVAAHPLTGETFELERRLPGVAPDLGTWHRVVLLRTKLSELSSVFSVGRYIDTVVRTEQGLKFASRQVIYNSEMILNSIIYPI